MKRPQLRITSLTWLFVCLGVCFALCGGLYLFFQMPYQCPSRATKGDIIIFGAYRGGVTWIQQVFAKRAVCVVDTGGTVAGAPGTVQNIWKEETAWSPDGQWTVFSTRSELSRAGGISKIYLFRSGGSGKPMEIATGSEPAWSRDGSRIAYFDPDRGLHLLNVECVLQDQPCVFSPTFLVVGSEPDWSSDSQQIVYNGDPAAEKQGGIFVINVDGMGQPTRISPPEVYCHEPRWSPRSAAIAFWCQDGIYTVNADGTNLKLLIKHAGAPRWSPDGNQLAFVGGHAVDSELGKRVGLYFGFTEAGPDLSNAIFLVNADGTGLRRLTLDNYQKIGQFRWMARDILDRQH